MTEFQMHDAFQMYLTNFWKDFTLHGDLKMKGHSVQRTYTSLASAINE